MEIKTGKIRIVLDEAQLEHDAKDLMDDWDPELEEDTKLTETKYREEIQRLVDLAKEIMTSAQIFDYLPITKSGKFHATKTVIVAQSKINRWSYYKGECIGLKLKHPPKSDGTVMYLELEWVDRKKTDIPIYTTEHTISEAYQKPLSPISPLDFKPGYLYEDPKGITYLYLGVHRVYSQVDVELDPGEKITWHNWVDFDINMLCAIRYTKALAKKLSGCHMISEAFQAIGYEMFQEKVGYESSMKFVKEGSQLLFDDHKKVEVSSVQLCYYQIGDEPVTNVRENKLLTIHIEPESSIKGLTIRQHGDYTIVLDPSLLEGSKMEIEFSYERLKPDIKWKSYKRALKRDSQKAYDLIKLPNLFDRIPLASDKTFGKSKILLLSTSIHSKVTKKQVGIYLKIYDPIELIRQFSNTSIPLCMGKVAFLEVDIGSEKGKAIF